MVTVRGRRVRLGVDGHLVGHPPSNGVGSTDSEGGSEGGSAAAEQPNRDRRRPRSDPQIQGPSEMPNRRRMTSMSLLWNVVGCQGVRASGQQCQRPGEGLGAPVEDACCGRCGRCGRRRRTGCNTMGPLRVCSAYQRAGQRRENVRGIRGIRGAGPEGAEARVNGRGGSDKSASVANACNSLCQRFCFGLHSGLCAGAGSLGGDNRVGLSSNDLPVRFYVMGIFVRGKTLDGHSQHRT